MTARFDTKTEESFSNLMKRKGVNCRKVENLKKRDPIPDFICEFNGDKIIFELKNFEESGSTKRLSQNFIIQNITFAGTTSRHISACQKKFLTHDFFNCSSALVLIDLRPFMNTKWNNVFIPEVEKALRDNLKSHPEIGNVILAGYNEPSNQMVSMRIYENKFSNRSINRGFFESFNHRYYQL